MTSAVTVEGAIEIAKTIQQRALIRLAVGRYPLEGPFDIVAVGALLRELVRLGYAREYYGSRTDNWGGYPITDAGRTLLKESMNT